MNWMSQIFFLIIILLIIFSLSELIFRLVLFIKEIICHRSHYIPFSYGAVFNFAFTFNFLTIIFLITSVVIFLILLNFNTFKEFLSDHQTILTLLSVALVFTNILTRGIETHHSTLNHVHWIRNNQVMDYGSGMASSYYYGYLNIIGPNHGDDRRGISERIEVYEDSHRITFPVKKLFIIVPESLFIPTNLSEDSDKLEQATSLGNLEIDRAGVRKRHYQNSVYKILNGKKWYVCAEGATPLQTYKEAIEASGDKTMKEMKHEIVLKFYNTLKRLIHEHESTRNKFEVVYYNDAESKGGDIGQLIEDRILEILKLEN